MPELPEVETVRRGLAPVLAGKRLERVEQRRADLRFAFPDGFVQQHNLHVTTVAGEPVSLRACLVVRMGCDGLITRIDEYLDPAELAPLLP